MHTFTLALKVINFQSSLLHSGMHWVTDPCHPHIEAGKRAVRLTFGVDPDMTRDGCSIPITLIMQVWWFILKHDYELQLRSGIL